jgi:hypothetical protein
MACSEGSGLTIYLVGSSVLQVENDFEKSIPKLFNLF